MHPVDYSFLLFVAVAFGLLWLMTSRGRKQQRAQQEFRNNLAPGDEIMTGSGLFGTVVEVDGDVITVESTPGNRTRWIRAAIAKKIDPPVEELVDDDEDELDDADTDAAIKGSFLVSLHGSTDKRIGHGYKIVIMRKGEPLQDMINGFLNKGTVLGRPCDIFKLDANSFLFTDDNKGIIYLVRKKGTTTEIASVVTAGQPGNANEGVIASDPKPSGENDRTPSKSCLGIFLVLGGLLIKSIL